MPDAVWIAAAAGAVAGAVLTVALLFARRLAMGARDLGSDAERATYRALHVAGLAAAELRSTGDLPSLQRAARHLRALLGAGAVAIVGPGDVVAVGGSVASRAEGAPGLENAARRIADRVRATNRRQVFPRRDAG